jgi:HEAT repeat protein
MPRQMADAVARRRAAAVAGHQRDAVKARSFLADPAPSVRATALGALARAGSLAVADLVEELAAGVPGNADPTLASALDDPDAGVVEAAAWASGERRPPERGIVAALAAVTTGHDDPICREAAVAALGAIGDPGGLPAILAATTDRPAVRRRAVLALAPFDGPEVDAAIDAALDDRDWQVRQAAEDITATPDD